MVAGAMAAAAVVTAARLSGLVAGAELGAVLVAAVHAVGRYRTVATGMCATFHAGEAAPLPPRDKAEVRFSGPRLR
jgi:hypothetical protein